MISVIWQRSWLCVSFPRILLMWLYFYLENWLLKFPVFGCCFPFSKYGYFGAWFLIFFCSWGILFYPMVRECLVGYLVCSIGIKFFIVTAEHLSNIFFSIMVSIERLGVIMIGLLKYVTWPFPFSFPNVLYLLCMLLCLMFCGVARGSIYSSLFLVLYASCSFTGISFLKLGKFSSTLFSIIFSLPSIPTFLRCCVWLFAQISCVFSVNNLLGLIFLVTFWWLWLWLLVRVMVFG